jgi:hypothetical protein
MPAVKDFPPQALRDYALIADGERGALIGPRGDVVWMCAPSWESEAVFASLIGGSGLYVVSPLDTYTWGGYYEPRSLIWRSRWVTTSAIVESREALSWPADMGRAVLLRRVRAVTGPARVLLQLDVRAGYGREAMQRTHRDDDGVWTGASGGIGFRWTGAAEAHRAGRGPLVAELELAEGEERDLVLEIGPGTIDGAPLAAAECWQATESAWSERIPRLGDGALGGRDAETALAVLSGLTSQRGGLTAAATTSLPERAQENRNYDYRYAWIRDQCYAGHAVAAHGHDGMLDRVVKFVVERLLEDGPTLKPAYTVAGGPVPDESTLPHLAGYPGGSDKIGNWVNGQFQLDTFGEILELLSAAARVDRIDVEQWRAVEAAVAAIEQRWQEPDAGIWELDPARWAHSRLTCVSGLRSIAQHAPVRQAGPWSSLADVILADVAGDCLHPDGRWQRAPGDPRVDASLLLPGLRGALPADDPRTAATVSAVEQDLTRDGYVFRFRPDDRPLGAAEGGFLLCNFLLAMSFERAGDRVLARSLFERGRSACGTPGLLAEEFDVEQRQLRGNIPQAFVHAMLLECSAVLSDRFEPGQKGTERSI